MNFLIWLIIFILILGVVSLLFSKQKKKKPVQRSFGIPSITEKGDKVRSKAEKIVADFLFENEIEYIYEQTIELGRKKDKIKYDFYLPKYDIYVEYWGLGGLDNEIGEQYRARKEEKIELYDKHGLKLISIYQSNLNNLDVFIPKEISRLDGKRTKLKLFLSKKIKELLFDIKIEEEIDNQKPSTIDYFCTSCGSNLSGKNEYCIECGEFNP